MRTGWGKMDGRAGMHGVKVVTGAAAAVLLLAFSRPTPALADTIEAALAVDHESRDLARSLLPEIAAKAS